MARMIIVREEASHVLRRAAEGRARLLAEAPCQWFTWGGMAANIRYDDRSDGTPPPPGGAGGGGGLDDRDGGADHRRRPDVRRAPGPRLGAEPQGVFGLQEDPGTALVHRAH